MQNDYATYKYSPLLALPFLWVRIILPLDLPLPYCVIDRQK